MRTPHPVEQPQQHEPMPADSFSQAIAARRAQKEQERRDAALLKLRREASARNKRDAFAPARSAL